MKYFQHTFDRGNGMSVLTSSRIIHGTEIGKNPYMIREFFYAVFLDLRGVFFFSFAFEAALVDAILASKAAIKSI
ncbi:hypothetical protein UFO1_1725 [Pelosinus sp. UFO1]|nr:hypothetical protein UFO1_1725 [Pelosinus sp. UFO1]